MSTGGVRLAAEVDARRFRRTAPIGVGVRLNPFSCDVSLRMDLTSIPGVRLRLLRLAVKLTIPSCVMLMPGVMLVAAMLAISLRMAWDVTTGVNDAP